MQVTKHEKYHLYQPNSADLVSFLGEINNSSDIKEQHVIVDISLFDHISIADLELLLSLAEEKIENFTSLVIIAKGIDIDDVPDELKVAPTLVEAKDIIDMDAMERDLMGL